MDKSGCKNLCSTLTPSSGQTLQPSMVRSTSRDSPIHYLSTIIWWVFR